jgi:hypothetical protein
MSQKNPVTSPGIDPGTVRLVAQRFSHYTTPGHTIYDITYLKKRRSVVTHTVTILERAVSLNIKVFYARKVILCPYILWPHGTSHIRFSRARRYSNVLHSSRAISSVRPDIK